ncbi:MAG: hypothetical protein NZZ41_02270 [Candidatus Dojkabacteria bacterium]|nr:hypothetical protein [Candidatus Dojkabacteria bacterium]
MKDSRYYDFGSYSLKDISDFVPEEDKLKPLYLIGNCNRHIADLVIDKIWEKKCNDFYNGRRDAAEFQHIVDNYGVQHPMSLPFIPIMAKMIKALANVQLQNAFDYKITCQNQEALVLKMEQRKQLLLDEIYMELKKKLQDSIKKQAEIYQKIKQDPQRAEEIQREFEEDQKRQQGWIETLVQRLNAKYGSSWLTDFEVAANSYMQYYIDRYNLKQIFHLCMQDLCVTGQMYIRTYIKELGKDPVTEICNPEETFFDYTDNILWLQNAKRVVYRRWMTAVEILNEFGHLIDEEDRKRLDDILTDYYSNHSPWRQEMLAVERGNEEHLYYSGVSRTRHALIPVYHVEWLSPNPVKDDLEPLDLVRGKVKNIKGKVRYRVDRYECYKIDIGTGIYFGYGKSEFVSRSRDNPYTCTLSYNGMVYRGRNNKPYSLVWATRDIQNMYDITHYQLNNLFATAEPGGVITPIEHIPESFGNTPEERMIKAKAYRKLGMGHIISISQEGLEGQFAFNNYGTYQSNLDGNLLQAYMTYLEILENQAMNIVGLNRQILGQMEELDGKGTTTMAIRQGEIINKDLYFLIGTFIKQTLTNIVNLSRLTIKDGWIGSITQGSSHKIFSIDAEKYQLADYNVFISDDLEDTNKFIVADQLMMKAIEAQVIDLKTAFDVLMTNSISKRKQVIEQAFSGTEASALMQLQQAKQELEAAQKQIQELQKQIEKLGGRRLLIDEQKLKIEEKRLEQQAMIEIEKLQLMKQKIEGEKEIKEEALRIEKAQISDNSPYNNPVNKNIFSI